MAVEAGLKWLELERQMIQKNQGTEDDGTVRKFSTGATRDTNDGKLDFEGFLCPMVIERYAEYMHANRLQSDGTMRDSDNWQKGIPRDVYMKSMWRHFFATWQGHRSGKMSEVDLCALLFNVMGYLHEILKESQGWRNSGGKIPES